MSLVSTQTQEHTTNSAHTCGQHTFRQQRRAGTHVRSVHSQHNRRLLSTVIQSAHTFTAHIHSHRFSRLAHATDTASFQSVAAPLIPPTTTVQHRTGCTGRSPYQAARTHTYTLSLPIALGNAVTDCTAKSTREYDVFHCTGITGAHPTHKKQ